MLSRSNVEWFVILFILSLTIGVVAMHDPKAETKPDQMCTSKPFMSGEPGYQASKDWDKDGIAC